MDPAHQHGGLGTELARAAESSAPAAVGRFVGQCYGPSPADTHAFMARFAAPLGYSVATTETVVGLAIAHAELDGGSVPEGYEVMSFVNGMDQRFVDQVGQVKGLVDAEAPNGELGWGETPVSPEQSFREIDLWVTQGRTAIESIAVTQGGAVAAWTCVVVPATSDAPTRPRGRSSCSRTVDTASAPPSNWPVCATSVT